MMNHVQFLQVEHNIHMKYNVTVFCSIELPSRADMGIIGGQTAGTKVVKFTIATGPNIEIRSSLSCEFCT